VPPESRSETSDVTSPERRVPVTRNPDLRLETALAALADYRRTNDRKELNRAQRIAASLISTSDNGLVPHTFRALNALGQPLRTPWYSAQTQGLLLSVLVRMYESTGDERWADAADPVFRSLTLARNYLGNSAAEPPEIWLSYVGDGHKATNLWFEKFWRQAGPDYYNYPTLVIDAHITAVFGIYDYWRMTKSPAAARLFAGGASTVLSSLPTIRRAGEPSRTMLTSSLARLDHHRVVTGQLSLLAKMTGEKVFAEFARELRKDAS
jgi:hypothetical protein